MTPEKRLEHGQLFPFDETSDEHEARNSTLETLPLEPKDWTIAAARGVLADLGDRRGVGQELDDIDDDIRKELVEQLSQIIKLAHERYHKG